jgi:NADPH2:quinone reductase
MHAIVYTRTGDPTVLRLVEREPVDLGPGEVRVRIAVSGVNPTDWKSRLGAGPGRGRSRITTPGPDLSGCYTAPFVASR